MAEDNVSQGWAKSPGPRPKVVERQRVAKEQEAQRVWTEQNEMRDDLGRMTGSAAQRFFIAANVS